MRKPALFLTAALAIPAVAQAEGFNLMQLLQADFEVKAAVPGAGGGPGRTGPSPGFDTLYLQGKLSGSNREIVIRCIVRPDPEEGASNCQQVY